MSYYKINNFFVDKTTNSLITPVDRVFPKLNSFCPANGYSKLFDYNPRVVAVLNVKDLFERIHTRFSKFSFNGVNIKYDSNGLKLKYIPLQLSKKKRIIIIDQIDGLKLNKNLTLDESEVAEIFLFDDDDDDDFDVLDEFFEDTNMELMNRLEALEKEVAEFNRKISGGIGVGPVVGQGVGLDDDDDVDVIFKKRVEVLEKQIAEIKRKVDGGGGLLVGQGVDPVVSSGLALLSAPVFTVNTDPDYLFSFCIQIGTLIL